MDDNGSDLRRSLIKEILKSDINEMRTEIATNRLPRKSSVVHLPSSTVYRWRNSYMWVKSFALLMMMIGGVSFMWSAESILNGNLLGGFLAVVMTAGGAAIAYIIELGERELGLWRYERIESSSFLPKFQWRFIAWD